MYTREGITREARAHKCSDALQSECEFAMPVGELGEAPSLKGKPVTPDAVRAATEVVVDQVDPLTDFRGSAEYKQAMAIVFTRRALEQVLGLPT